MAEDILLVRKKSDGIRFKIVEPLRGGWSPAKYENTLKSHDANRLALIFFDLEKMGYPVSKAVGIYKRMNKDPSTFFMR